MPSNGNRSLEPVIDGPRPLMSANRSGVALPVLLRSAGEELRPSGMIAQAEDGRVSNGPRELGMAHVGAGAGRACAVRCLGALDQTPGRGTRLDPRAAVAVVDVVEPYETEHRADAWYGWPPIQGVGLRLVGGCEAGQFHVAAPRVVVVNQGQVDVETLLHGGLGTPLSDTRAVRCRGDLLADCGPAIRASGMLDVGSPLRPLAHQRPAAPEEIARGPHRGGVPLGLGQHAATPEYGHGMGVELVVCGLAPRDRRHVQGMAEDQRDAFVRTEVGQPVPRAQAFDCDDEPCSIGRHDVQTGLRGRLHRTVHEHLATLVEETDIHGTSMQIDATRTLVRLGVESPEVSSSVACVRCSPNASRPRWDAEAGASISIKALQRTVGTVAVPRSLGCA